MSDKGDCRTAPATPGLLNIVKYNVELTWEKSTRVILLRARISKGITQGWITQGKLLNVELPKVKSLKLCLPTAKLSKIGMPIVNLCLYFPGITQG